MIRIFPFHLPDETHASQAARYHHDSGNAEARRSYKELYGTVPFSIAHSIPKNLERFVARLPGHFDKNLQDALHYTTHFPLFKTFGGAKLAPGAPDQPIFDRLIDLPTRIVGEQGQTQLCLDCIHADIEDHGQPYIHRTHQVPGVNACPHHQSRLVSACPACGCPFARPKDLVLAHVFQCDGCGRDIKRLSFRDRNGSISAVSLAYARFAYDLLQHGRIALTPHQLAALYRVRAHDLGFGTRKQVDHHRILTALEGHFGREFLLATDAAYRGNKTENWLRILTGSAAAEVPLPRHLLIASFLFDEANEFHRFADDHKNVIADRVAQAGESRQSIKRSNPIHRQEASPPRPNRKPSVSPLHSGVVAKTAEQANVLKVLADHPEWELEDLWRHRRKAMKQLSGKHADARDWLDNILASGVAKSSDDSGDLVDRVASDDVAWAARVAHAAITHYGAAVRPTKLTRNRLLKIAGWKRSRSPRHQEYPLTRQQVEAHAETDWHFYARRILYAVLTTPPSKRSLTHVYERSGLEFHRARALFEHFASVLNRTTPLRPGSIAALLIDFGVDNTWDGPDPSRPFPKAGRGYVAVGRTNSPK